ncbi:unnamed protein product, partial [Ixodes pacificus]
MVVSCRLCKTETARAQECIIREDPARSTSHCQKMWPHEWHHKHWPFVNILGASDPGTLWHVRGRPADAHSTCRRGKKGLRRSPR